MAFYMTTYANPVADQWYRSLRPNQRMLLKAEFTTVTGMSWEDAGVMFSIRERIAIFHQKLVAESVIRPCGY